MRNETEQRGVNEVGRNVRTYVWISCPSSSGMGWKRRFIDPVLHGGGCHNTCWKDDVGFVGGKEWKISSHAVAQVPDDRSVLLKPDEHDANLAMPIMMPFMMTGIPPRGPDYSTVGLLHTLPPRSKPFWIITSVKVG